MFTNSISIRIALIVGSVFVPAIGNAICGQGLRPASQSGAQSPLRSADNNRAVASEPGDKIVIGANLVNIAVAVSDTQGRFVPGLSKDEFEVFDNGVRQQVAHFSDLDAPISIGIVYDVSGSMGGKIDRSARALKRFIETSHDQDAFFLITFNGRSALAQDFTRGDPTPIVDRLASVRPYGQTALYDAVYLALEKVNRGPHARQAILLISDGQDNNSSHSFAELCNAIKESGVMIYTIGITAQSGDRRPDIGRFVLDQIAEMSGGRSFFPTPYDESGLMEDCARIALELRHQYSIGFYPTDPLSETKYHRIKVRVAAPKEIGRLSLAYRERYQSFREHGQAARR
jgi:Ca-activated chloride channel homolog